ncbi:MAG TPA: GNAT family N-acetyltransferase [Pyrinomonadaceae bacterium]|nr:GNAT family N-acetyltransferase [Pyrinomonadaceae bacterium]
MSVVVRRANSDDALKVGELAYKLAVQHRNYDAKRFSVFAKPAQMAQVYGRQTQAKDAAVLVAELEKEIVGFAYLEFEAINYAGLLENAVWLHDIYIEEAARGKNVGKLLIEFSAETAKKLGANKLMLSVAAKNEFARNFFENQGFKPTMVEMMLDLTENDA